MTGAGVRAMTFDTTLTPDLLAGSTLSNCPREAVEAVRNAVERLRGAAWIEVEWWDVAGSLAPLVRRMSVRDAEEGVVDALKRTVEMVAARAIEVASSRARSWSPIEERPYTDPSSSRSSPPSSRSGSPVLWSSTAIRFSMRRPTALVGSAFATETILAMSASNVMRTSLFPFHDPRLSKLWDGMARLAELG